MCLKASRLSHGVGVALQASGRPITHAQPRHRFPVGDGTGLDWLGAGGLPWGGDGCWETGFDGGSQSGRVELRSRQPRPPWVINKVALCSVCRRLMYACSAIVTVGLSQPDLTLDTVPRQTATVARQ